MKLSIKFLPAVAVFFIFFCKAYATPPINDSCTVNYALFQALSDNAPQREFAPADTDAGQSPDRQITNEDNISWDCFGIRMPEFPGGEDAFGKWLAAHLKYPRKACKTGIEGKVILRFMVMQNGKVKDIRVMSSPDKSLSEEAVRVLRRSPRWRPGREFGHSANFDYTLPVTFCRPDE